MAPLSTFAVALAASVLLHAGTESRQIELDGDIYRIRFDPARVTWTQLQPLLRLGPDFEYVAHSSLMLELCTGRTPEYSPCGSRDIEDPNFLTNAAVNVRLFQKQLDLLSKRRVPLELEPVKEFLLRRQKLHLEIGLAALEYYRSWNPRVLLAMHPDHQAKACDAFVAEARAQPTRMLRYRTARFKWHNCQNEAVHRLVGRYPKDAWEQWLRSAGVTVTYLGRQDPE